MTRELLPYSGHRPRTHNPHIGTRSRVEHLDKVYHFNELGYRCESLDEAADHTLFVVGDSVAFGFGLNDDETLCAHLARVHERKTRPATRLCIQNFSSPGSSVDYAVRQVLAQCSRFRPSLVYTLFSTFPRSEMPYEGNDSDAISVALGPWCMRENWVPDLYYRPPHEGSPASGAYVERALNYYGYYTDVVGALAYLKNAVLLQEYLANEKIPWVWSSHQLDAMVEHTLHPCVRPFFERLDLSNRIQLSSLVDFAADGQHPGPQTCSRWAEELYAHFERMSCVGLGSACTRM
jgi:hypothetical protein